MSLRERLKFDLHENEPVGGTHFDMNGFALTRFETEAKSKSEMACSSTAWGENLVSQQFLSYVAKQHGISYLSRENT